MYKLVSFAATAALLGSISGGAVAAPQRPVGTFSDILAVTKITEDPPRASKTGRANRSATANKKGANQKGFCPAGQRKKPGKGSAFDC